MRRSHEVDRAVEVRGSGMNQLARTVPRSIPAFYMTSRVMEELHRSGYGDTHDGERPNQLAADDGGVRQQKLFPLLVGLAQDRMAMIKSVEQLRQLERVFGQIRGLGGGNALRHNL